MHNEHSTHYKLVEGDHLALMALWLSKGNMHTLVPN